MKSANKAFILAIEYYAIVCVVSIVYLLSRTHGPFVYPLDDTYISMAIAKNMAQYGVMGFTRHAFTFSSSCPLWITIMAGVDWIAGARWWIPLAMSLVAGIAALLVASRVLEGYGIKGGLAIGALVSLCILTPLPAMGLSGMEHAMHIALVLPFVAGACRFLERDTAWAPREFWKLTAILAVMVTVRYESLFLGGLFALLLAVRRRWLYAVLSLLAALAPVALLGLFSVSHGWQWLPNSLLLKGGVPDLSSLTGIIAMLGGRSVRMLVENFHLLGLMSLMVATSIWRALRGDNFWSRGPLMLFFAMAGTMVHLQFASVGWFYRYEAYLVALGVIALFANRADLLARELLERRWTLRLAAALIVLAAMVPLGGRAAESIAGFPMSAHNIYEQQYQMALFLQKYYNGASIAANDVGAMNYMADLRCLDLIGLCDREIFLLKRRNAYDSAAMQAQAERAGVRIALVYDTWFSGYNPLCGPRIPSTWTRVGRWRIPDNEYNGSDTVSFYAVVPAEAEYLTRSLQDFASRLPDGVTQTGSYMTAGR